MYKKLFSSDDYISSVVRSCRGFREFVKDEILKGVGGATSSSGVNENNEPIQYIGTNKVLIQGDVLTFIDKVFWITYHIERFVTRNTPAKSRYPDLKIAIANIPGKRFNSSECIKLTNEAISFFAKYDEDLAGNNKAISDLKIKARQHLIALANVFVDERKSYTVIDKLEQLDAMASGAYNSYSSTRDSIASYCNFLFEYINEAYDCNLLNLLDFEVDDVRYWPTGVDFRTDDNFYYRDESEDNTKRFAPPTVNIKQIDTYGVHKALMALNDIRYDSFEEFIQAMADNLWDYTDKADASYIIDIIYDYRTQVTKKFPNAEFDVSMDVFENVMMALQRVINNLYNPALVNIIEKEQWV
jgi:hypothetical protein